MHEHGVMAGLMHRICELAESEGAAKVTTVSVWLGALSQMSPEHFRGHFKEASTGTLADGADLDIITSADLADPNATGVLITGVEVEAPG